MTNTYLWSANLFWYWSDGFKAASNQLRLNTLDREWRCIESISINMSVCSRKLLHQSPYVRDTINLASLGGSSNSSQLLVHFSLSSLSRQATRPTDGYISNIDNVSSFEKHLFRSFRNEKYRRFTIPRCIMKIIWARKVFVR